MHAHRTILGTDGRYRLRAVRCRVRRVLGAAVSGSGRTYYLNFVPNIKKRAKE